jgi:hypothetical protein
VLDFDSAGTVDYAVGVGAVRAAEWMGGAAAAAAGSGGGGFFVVGCW